MTNRGAGCWENRLSGSKRGWSATLDMDEILWHRWETRRQTENTNFILCLGESPAYSNTVQRINPKGSERPDPTRPIVVVRAAALECPLAGYGTRYAKTPAAMDFSARWKSALLRPE